MTPREGLDLIQAETLDSPLFRLFPSPDPGMIQDIISRMTISEGVPSAAIAKMITNQAFLRAFADAKDEAKREELIQGVYATFIEELEEENKRTRATIAELSAGMREREEREKEMQVDRERLELEIQRLSTGAAALRDSAQQDAKKIVEITNSKAELDQKIQMMSGDLQAMSNQALESVTKYQREIEQIRQESQQEREYNRDLLERLERNQQKQQDQIIRQRKFFFIGLTWVTYVITLITLRPWEWDGDMKWVTLTITVVAATVTQFIAFYRRAMHRYVIAALVAINTIALAVTSLLPFGISISETWGMIVGAANIIAAAYAAFALLPSNKP